MKADRKPTANERRLDRIYEGWLARLSRPGESFGQYAARYGVLAVCTKTVPVDHAVYLATLAGRQKVTDGKVNVTSTWKQIVAYLRRLARGAR